ncbi:MAG: NADH-quinone oxidoreductase subunit J [Deltaproteobacteria bacterium]|nr:NADH-quinone oxidoreductase subunit J [Deltaproteobacteria bacterium]
MASYVIDWQLAFFFVFAAVAVVAAVGVLACRSPLHSALCLVGTMVALAAIYLLHHAEFIAFVQIMVYAGAVMMLVVYVIMLLDIKHEEELRSRLTGTKVFAVLLGAALLLALLYPLAARLTGTAGTMTAAALAKTGSVEFLADQLFGPYLLPFEAASVLLTVGLVGAVALAKKKL